MRLLSLPDEVLDLTLKNLLPSFFSQSLAETYVLAVPADLLVARLVSRRLHRIATPLAWRRTQLQITSPSAANYNDSAAIVVAAQTSFRSLMRCRFFQEHPELATHVRILLISLEWHAESPDLARDALRAATKAMSSLRTVLVWDTDVLAFRDIRQLLQKPLLHTICLIDIDSSTFPSECNLGTSLKMLRIVNSVCPAILVVGAGAFLECVSIELARSYRGTRSVLTLREMPWKSLKEVALVGCANDFDWFCFLDGFKASLVFVLSLRMLDGTCATKEQCMASQDQRSFLPQWVGPVELHVSNKQWVTRWKREDYVLESRLWRILHRSRGLHTALTELLIGDLEGHDPARVNRLLHTFTGQPLTRLILYHIVKIDAPAVSRIFKAFPGLRHLTLLTDSELTPWPGALDMYAQIIAGFPLLETLAWNNFSLDPALDAAFSSLGNDMLGALYAPHAFTLMQHVRHLQYIKLTSVTDCIVDTIDVTRIKSGNRTRNRSVSPVEVRRTMEAALHTSSWSTTSDAFQDI